MLTEQRHTYTRWLMAGFTLALAALLAIWSYRSSAQISTSLTVTPDQARQNQTVTLIGQGFQPNETVGVWVTYPDFSVFSVAEVETNADGAFNFPYLPDFLSATVTPTGKFTYTARGTSSGREVYATLQVNIGAAPGTSREVQLQVIPSRDDQGSIFTFRGEGYGTEEEVALWVRFPDNTVTDQGRVMTGPAGSFEYSVRVTGAPVGRYAFTARGLRTGLNGIAEFNLTVGDMTRERGKANLRVRPSNDDQRSTAIFEGYNFQPDEVISIWVTLPDFSTAPIGDVKVSADGAFVASFFLSETLPAGKHTFTAYGNSSGLRATTELTLRPGGTPGTRQELAPAGDPLQIIAPTPEPRQQPEAFDAPADAQPTAVPTDPNQPQPTTPPAQPTTPPAYPAPLSF